jgi:hypothetical protein
MTPLFRNLTVLVAAASLAVPTTAVLKASTDSAVVRTATNDDAFMLVPANAVTLGKVHLAAMRSSPLSSLLFQHIDKVSSDGDAERFLREAGLRPLQDVDAVVVATAPRATPGREADVLVIAEGRFVPERLAAALIARGGVKKGAYIVFPESAENSSDDTGAVAFLSRSIAIMGNERSVVNALAARATGGTRFAERGDLALGLALVDQDSTAWALVDVQRVARLTNASSIETGNSPYGAAVKGALKSVSTVAVWATDTGESLQRGGKGLSNDTETLALLEDAIRGAFAGMRIAVREKAPEMVSVLRGFEVDRKADSITVEGSIPASMIRDLLAKQVELAKK